MNQTIGGKAGLQVRWRPSPRNFWPVLLWLMALLVLGLSAVWAIPEGHILRFSDTPYLHQPISAGVAVPIMPIAAEPDSPMTSAGEWLNRNGWKQVWPLMPLSKRDLPSFAGPATQRYLRINADDKFYIWGRLIDVDPHRFPLLNITWGVERFPRQAALDIYGRNDRPIVVTVSLGPKIRSPGLLPNVPRTLAFFWGETETVGTSYTCIKPRQGPVDRRMQCKYPHVKYIALQRGNAGSIRTDRVNLLEYFRQYFPDYWKRHGRVPPVVGVSFEARSDKTESVTVARLYSIAFTANASPNGGGRASPAREGN